MGHLPWNYVWIRIRQVRHAGVGYIHGVLVWAQRNPVWNSDCALDDADSACRGAESVRLLGEDGRRLREIQSRGVPWIREEDVTG